MSEKPKHPGGRPTKYTPELAKLICERVATSPHGIRKLCAMHDDMPDHTSIHLWKFKYPEFSSQYLDAKKAQMDYVMEELDEIMDASLIYYSDDKGNQRIDSPSATIAIAKANNRKWFASKIAPKLYGTPSKDEETNDDANFSKIKGLVDDLNKANQSDI